LFGMRCLCQRERLLKFFDLRTCHAPSAPRRAHTRTSSDAASHLLM
jgi:hypothetical protein